MNIIQEVRQKRKMTQQELADKTELSLSMIKAIESNKRTPSIKNIVRISKALNCSSAKIFLQVAKEIS